MGPTSITCGIFRWGRVVGGALYLVASHTWLYLPTYTTNQTPALRYMTDTELYAAETVRVAFPLMVVPAPGSTVI